MVDPTKATMDALRVSPILPLHAAASQVGFDETPIA